MEFVQNNPQIAYFSMEIGIDPNIPTYSGGLGVLAGDILHEAADRGLDLVGITLLHRKGYFHQNIDADGNQTESPCKWSPDDFMEPLDEYITVKIEQRDVKVRAWKYKVKGFDGNSVPILFLDTSLSENTPWDQSLTDHLYGGDDHYRLCQESILGLGGVAMLRALGYTNIDIYHKNEGHAALLALALLEDEIKEKPVEEITEKDRESVRKKCVFTTHTPVPAGHDQFPTSLVKKVLGQRRTELLESTGCCPEGILNMTLMSLYFSYYINGVSMRHEDISHSMFPNYPINSITNGVHLITWVSKSYQELFDQHFPQWRKDNLYIRYAIHISLDEISHAHLLNKEILLNEIKKRTGVTLNRDVMTIGFARRAASYKRADLLLSDIDRLVKISETTGPVQIIYAGKAHPRDEGGKTLIRNIYKAAKKLKNKIKVIYLEEYDINLAKMLCAGVDMWLNTPQKPYEASGTSGMKAAVNGVPNFSVLDGWWIEGHCEGITGWSIGDGWEEESNVAVEINSLYNKLENIILPMFYKNHEEFTKIRRSAIALDGSFFNTQRMMHQYISHAYINKDNTDN